MKYALIVIITGLEMNIQTFYFRSEDLRERAIKRLTEQTQHLNFAIDFMEVDNCV